jgi:hypothetical protein
LKGGIGRDFEFFYRLAASNPTVRVPHGGTTTPPDIAKICDTDLFPKEMDVTTFNRPICPMATFFQ